MNPAPPPQPKGLLAGIYWPTFLATVAALVAVGATAMRQWERRRATESPALADEGPARLSTPEHNLAAPAHAPLGGTGRGRPMQADGGPLARPGDSTRMLGAGAGVRPPAEAAADPRRVQPDMQGPSVAVDSSLGMVRAQGGVVGAAAGALHGDPYSDPADLAQRIGLAPAMTFNGEGGPAAPSTKVIASDKDWRALWKSISHGQPPPLNFKKQMLVAVFGGKLPAGKGVKILSTGEKDGKFRVRWRWIAGAPTAKKGVWRPYEIVATVRSPFPVVFEEVKR